MMTEATRPFLVPSGYNFRAVLAFCRALRRAGQVPAIVACTVDDPIFRTDFADDVVYIRTNRHLEVADFAAAVAAARKRSGAERCVLAPASEFLVRWALRQRPALAAAGCDLPLPDEEAYLRVTDKAVFTNFCRERGMPVPVELARLTAADLPAVAKPRWNVAPDGRSLYPWLLRTPADLARFQAEARPEDFFFQEWVEGRSFYLLFHLPRTGAATVYSQENLAQQPEGKSVLLARAARLHATAEAACWEGTLRAAGFHGVVMLELRQRGADYVLIEANPRLWGPLQLCLDGCPELLGRYIAEHTGAAPVLAAGIPAGPAPHYLWWGGVAAGPAPVWHGRTPWSARLGLLRHLGSDVYLRPDSWRQFFHEQRPAVPPSAVPVAKTITFVPTH